ncbi:MAG: 50S ribosomal protein L4 [Thermoplasmata archaeon]|jgi:large subunit ribosomal protein L4e|nr:50S ribosomal protein L4 [Thermoplasmata archaeon]MVT13791.1 50S ribosomal protein L4 [Euryarchaeota archaeon]MVT15196.1 50S ribosomal protein L4 [Euryarchaeota archaeon]MVT35696.1 50S ribosomal protein L4 [Euryarchaeota archaeon]
MIVNLYDIEGNVKSQLQLPKAFDYPFRPDLIRRAVKIMQSNSRQPYGVSPMAGLRRVGHNWGPNHGRARVPRIPNGDRGVIMNNMVGGRTAHAPTTQRKWQRKMNKKEKLLSKLSALAQTANREMVRKRGHRFKEDLTLPVVVEDTIENVEKVSDALTILRRLGLEEDVLRAKNGEKIRAGRGKTRGRKYYTPKSILIVLKNKEKALKSFSNLPGVEVITPSEINTEILAPGAMPGRLVLFSKGAIDEIRGWIL